MKLRYKVVSVRNVSAEGDGMGWDRRNCLLARWSVSYEVRGVCAVILYVRDLAGAAYTMMLIRNYLLHGGPLSVSTLV